MKSETVSYSVMSLCDPMDYSLPDSSVHGILQARILEWVDGHIPQEQTKVWSCRTGRGWTADLRWS